MSITFDQSAALPASARRAGTIRSPQSDSWRLVSAPWRLLCRCAERRGQRRALAELAAMPHLLNDLGLTERQALDEARKPFWRR